MLLAITNTHRPATDLGYLLHKNPARAASFDLAFGRAHVVYPEASDERCTAALILDIDPVGLVRGRPGSAGEGGPLEQYVNDRPYVASSFLSVAIAQVFGTALGGRSKDRPELAAMPIPLHAVVSVLPSRGGEPFLRRLFEPLGYQVAVVRHTLDDRYPEWGLSRYYRVVLTATVRLQDLLSHLYVLIPVLDDDKHYWVGDAEVDKLLRHGAAWLKNHPEREAIVGRYLRRRGALVRDALARLRDDASPDAEAEAAEQANAAEADLEERVSLHQTRLQTVLAELTKAGARTVLDLGCGEGRLLTMLLEEPQFTRVVGVDASSRALEIAAGRLRLDRLPPARRARIQLLHGALTYRDRRLEGFDAAAVVEVVEHLDPPRLANFERALFQCARPRTVVLTTPNREYNVKFASLPAGQLRHRDHRFEWTRDEFREWAEHVAGRFCYHGALSPLGPVDEMVGAPSQMAVFTLT
jgi:3' terminal RNA ribose 2'-O-methyltransferase Hen1